MNKNLAIIFYDNIDKQLGENLLQNFKEIFFNIIDVFILIDTPMNLPPNSFNKLRNQYLSSPLLEELRTLAIRNGYFKILGIISADLYTEGLNFIFGQAEFGNPQETRAAIISTYRLKRDLEENESRFSIIYRRILKEAIHELGHTLNLSHCKGFCVMRFSNSLLEADNKPISFCKICKKKISSSLFP
ncbi:MAG: hypothetical protein EAX96_09495 [Candidatus Lokiarchaeota archaeon]|nr:hypothetical protein [Candidatus Lokiarchaeota archaeon]